MAAAVILPVSGPYFGTYNGLALGTQNDDGFVLRGTYQGQEINMSDAYGMTLVEAIYRGLNWRLLFRSLEFGRPGVLNAMQVFGAAGAPSTTFTPVLSAINTQIVGDRWSKFSKALILTAMLGNPPCAPATLTALSAIVAPQSNIEFLMTSKVREAPFEMVLLPYNAILGPVITTVASFTTT